MAEERDSAEALVSEIHKKITDAFEVFDHEFNKTVDIREIGTIIRSLGCFPSEGELHDIIAEVEEEEPTGYIHFEKFLPVMTKVLMELNEFSCNILILKHFVLHHILGEPFTREEMEEMFSAALDPDKNVIFYKDFVSMMTIEET
uniref:EF-hand calcium binding domain 2 n=1 Tax=Paramormyrops kingsleyae TaxID=1676925 RepID=A0A3B3RXP2_9TELE